MGLQIAVEIGNSGTIANYHKIQKITIDRYNNNLSIEVTSYKDLETRLNGKSPLLHDQINIPFALLEISIAQCYDILKQQEKYLNSIDI